MDGALTQYVCCASLSVVLWLGARAQPTEWMRGAALVAAPILSGAAARKSSVALNAHRFQKINKDCDELLGKERIIIETEAAIDVLEAHYRPWALPPQQAQAIANHGSLQGASPLPASEIFPVEDLALTIAESDSDEQNFLFVGKSQSGKTSILVNAMSQKTLKNQGLVDWFVFNGKPEQDNRWGGLVDSPNDYWAVNSKGRAIEMLGQFKVCVSVLQQWQDSSAQHYPMVICMDEVNNQRILLPTPQRRELGERLSLFATQCMSERSGLWLSTHSHNVDDIGLNKRLQQSFQVVCVGRNGKYESIAAVLDDEYIIRDRDLRQALKAQLQAYTHTGEKGAIAFTNLGGSSRLVKLPHYSKDVSLRQTALNSPAWASGDEVSQLRDQLERSWQRSDKNSGENPNGITPELHGIIQFCRENGGAVSSRDCQRRFKLSADTVKELFEVLEHGGWGRTVTDPSTPNRVVFRVTGDR
ncbi:hypothetical protein [Leptolyngbya sp. CCY15150]|uniref:hypothetical protein n=1 Tax=Leptolyngbya sp. CCY15150 TaxID=2767772 RepID=UPI001952055B|nr:hypothetical protein [Leptolyngbya sp. CCY15150]